MKPRMASHNPPDSTSWVLRLQVCATTLFNGGQARYIFTTSTKSEGINLSLGFLFCF